MTNAELARRLREARLGHDWLEISNLECELEAAALLDRDYVMVPREPTHEMKCAAINEIDETGFGPERAERVYRAMLAAWRTHG